MGRVSQEKAAEHRQQIIHAASLLFREKGMQNVSVQEIMGAVGLTHGGFYRQFESKEALLPEATREAYQNMKHLLTHLDQQHPSDPDASRADFLKFYLSEKHRDEPATGCPTAGLVTEIARENDVMARKALSEGIEHFADWLNTDTQDGLLTACTLVGAMLMARATAGTELSERILKKALAATLPADIVD